MNNSRVLLEGGGKTYQFLKLQGRPDGSILVFLDRDPTPIGNSGRITCDGKFDMDHNHDPAVEKPQAKISCHTTGEIHYYSGGKRQSTFHIPPLYALTNIHAVAFFSVPNLSRLDTHTRDEASDDTIALLPVPEIDERLNFIVELAPAIRPDLPTYGLILKYELYSLSVRLLPSLPFSIPAEAANHFIHGVITPQAPTSRAIDPATAELEFHRAAHGAKPIIFRERGGTYIALTAVPMRITPRLSITFDRSDLSAEQSVDDSAGWTHKVRFWICDRSGRNKREDLRVHIKSLIYDARM